MAANTIALTSTTLVLAVILGPKTTAQGSLTRDPNRARDQRLDTLRADPGILSIFSFLTETHYCSHMFIFDLRQSVCCLFSPPGRCPQYNQPPMWSTALPLPVTSLSPLLSLTHQALPSASSPFTATLKMRMIQSFLLPGEPRFQSGHLMLHCFLFPQLLVVSNKNVIFKTFSPAALEQVREPM